MKNTKVLLLDNNDSFTYSIVDYLRRIENITLKVIKTQAANVNKAGEFDKIIISPGPGLPINFPSLFDIIEKYYRSKKILGICLGHQAIGEFFSSKIVNVRPVIHGQPHKLNVIKLSPIFNGLPSSFDVGLYHSWALDVNGFPDDLEVTSLSENNVIMSIESKNHEVYGIQFHPESYITHHGYQILKNFVGLA
jgi:anthranilate synthase/aminodeoxychorismate synthase-like glutamine amidotransferase